MFAALRRAALSSTSRRLGNAFITHIPLPPLAARLRTAATCSSHDLPPFAIRNGSGKSEHARWDVRPLGRDEKKHILIPCDYAVLPRIFTRYKASNTRYFRFWSVPAASVPRGGGPEVAPPFPSYSSSSQPTPASSTSSSPPSIQASSSAPNHSSSIPRPSTASSSMPSPSPSLSPPTPPTQTHRVAMVVTKKISVLQVERRRMRRRAHHALDTVLNSRAWDLPDIVMVFTLWETVLRAPMAELCGAMESMLGGVVARTRTDSRRVSGQDARLDPSDWKAQPTLNNVEDVETAGEAVPLADALDAAAEVKPKRVLPVPKPKTQAKPKPKDKKTETPEAKKMKQKPKLPKPAAPVKLRGASIGFI